MNDIKTNKKKKIPKIFVGITLDSTLTKYNNAVIKWHNDTYNTKYDENDEKALKVISNDNVKICAFNNSTLLASQIESYDIKSNLCELRKYYDLVIITNRSRKIERHTREWIDKHYTGIFEKIHFTYDDEDVDDNSNDNDIGEIKSKKKLSYEYKAKKIQEICHDFHIDIFIDNNKYLIDYLQRLHNIHKIPSYILYLDDKTYIPELDYSGKKITLKEVNNRKNENDILMIKICNNWDNITSVLNNLATNEFKLNPETSIASPLNNRLTRYIDDLITISVKRSIVFYVKLILNKFRGQTQLRLNAMDESIPILLQVVSQMTNSRHLENYKKGPIVCANITNIRTSYSFSRRLSISRNKRNDNRSGYSVPKLKIVLKRSKEYEEFLIHDKSE